MALRAILSSLASHCHKSFIGTVTLGKSLNPCDFRYEAGLLMSPEQSCCQHNLRLWMGTSLSLIRKASLRTVRALLHSGSRGEAPCVTGATRAQVRKGGQLHTSPEHRNCKPEDALWIILTPCLHTSIS